MRKKLFTALSLVLALTMTSCSSSDTNKEDSKNDKTASESSDGLIIYSPNSEGLVNSVIPAFEEQTGINVELQQAGTGELFTKLKGEKQSPVADVIWGGIYTTYLENQDLFEEYVSVGDENLPEAYQNKEKFKTNYAQDGSVIIINKDLVGDIEINGYEDLLNPELKGKIATADPLSSSSAFAHLTDMLQAMGGYDSDQAWDYVENLFTNVDGKIQSSSSSVYKTVVDGEMAVGLSYEDPVLQLKKDGADNVDIVYMDEGVVFLLTGAAIIKDCDNLENAKKFMDFLVSKEAQDIIGTETTLRPVLEDAETNEFMTPLDEINVIEEDYAYVNEHAEEIQNRYKDIFADIQSK